MYCQSHVLQRTSFPALDTILPFSNLETFQSGDKFSSKNLSPDWTLLCQSTGERILDPMNTLYHISQYSANSLSDETNGAGHFDTEQCDADQADVKQWVGHKVVFCLGKEPAQPQRMVSK